MGRSQLWLCLGHVYCGLQGKGGRLLQGDSLIPAPRLQEGTLAHRKPGGQPLGEASEVAGTIAAQDLLLLRDEAFPHQRGSTPRTVEAIVVPVPIFKGDVFASFKTWR